MIIKLTKTITFTAFSLSCLILAGCNEAPLPKTSEQQLNRLKQSTIFDNLDAKLQQAMLECDIDSEGLTSLMGLSYQEFDQNFEGGWRAIKTSEDCSIVASKLIDLYILYSSEIDSDNIRTLRWHSGQNLAEMGAYQKAHPYFAAAKQNGDSESAKLWNIYVDSTLAFIERDKAKLNRLFEELAQFPVSEKEKLARQKFLDANPNISMPEGFVDEPQNLSVVRRLLECFDDSYKVAYYGSC